MSRSPAGAGITTDGTYTSARRRVRQLDSKAAPIHWGGVDLPGRLSARDG